MLYYWPQKENTNRTRLSVGVDIIEYPVGVSITTADTTTANIVWNSVVSTPRSKYMWIDINIFYLVTALTRYKYLRIFITLIPDNIIQQFNLLLLVKNGLIYLDIHKGMYVFPQEGRLENYLPT